MLSQDLSAIFGALADPTRRAILARLAQGEATVSELAEPFQLAQPTISKHLRVLEDVGLIESDRDAQRRPRRLVLAPLKAADAWLGPFRARWERRFDRLEDHLKKQSALKETEASPRHKRKKESTRARASRSTIWRDTSPPGVQHRQAPEPAPRPVRARGLSADRR